MERNIILAVTVFVAAAFLTSCTKEVPKEFQTNKEKQTTQQPQMPDDEIHRNLGKQPTGETEEPDLKKEDEKANKLMKEADDADVKYQKTKLEADKKVAIEKQMTAANYLMLEAPLSPKKKYRPALKRYNRVLELDPANEEAVQNKKMIEDIYQQMGMPIPED
jgi:lipoprotein NlpI